MKHLSALLFVILSVGTFAQEFPYEFTVTDETYAHFEDGFDAVLNTWDDPNAVLPMGFDFYFFERQIDTWYLSSDFLGGTLVGDPGPEGTAPIFFVYGSDLIDIGYPQDSLISTITYKTTGDAPNRIFHLQYENCGFYSEVAGNGTAGDQINLQMRMYEGSNDIEIHFGPNSIKNPDLAHDGMGGTSILMVDSLNYDFGTFNTLWLLQGDGQAPEVNAFTEEEVDDIGPGDFLTSDPSNGTLYRFSSSFVNVEEEVAQAGLHVYPNPSRDVVWVQSPAQGNQPFVLRSMSGAAVLDGTLRPGQNQVDLGGLPAGLYLLDTPASLRPTRIVKQ